MKKNLLIRKRVANLFLWYVYLKDTQGGSQELNERSGGLKGASRGSKWLIGGSIWLIGGSNGIKEAQEGSYKAQEGSRGSSGLKRG